MARSYHWHKPKKSAVGIKRGISIRALFSIFAADSFVRPVFYDTNINCTTTGLSEGLPASMETRLTYTKSDAKFEALRSVQFNLISSRHPYK